MRLEAEIADELEISREVCEVSGRPARVAREFRWCTFDSLRRDRRVIGKAEWTGNKAHPPFIVTSLKKGNGKYFCEAIYCARDETENGITACQLELLADRTSAKTMRANQLRLWFASTAYVLVRAAPHRSCPPISGLRFRIWKGGHGLEDTVTAD